MFDDYMSFMAFCPLFFWNFLLLLLFYSTNCFLSYVKKSFIISGKLATLLLDLDQCPISLDLLSGLVALQRFVEMTTGKQGVVRHSGSAGRNVDRYSHSAKPAPIMWQTL